MQDIDYTFPVDILDSEGYPRITVHLKDEFKTKSKCKACGATIYRAQTKKGKMIPISKQSYPDGGYDLVAHFAVCPKVGSFRK